MRQTAGEPDALGEKSPQMNNAMPVAVLCISLFVFLLFFPGPQAAQAELTGYVELIYSNIHNTTRDDELDATIKQRTNNFRQFYNLTLIQTIFPYLTFTASGQIEQNKTKVSSTLSDNDTDSTVTTIRPLVDLTLKNPLLTAGASYNEREQTTKVSGAPTLKLTREELNAVLLYRPLDLPSVDAHLQKTRTYDDERAFTDATEDFISLLFKYEPLRGLLLEYRPTITTNNNRLEDVETTQRAHNGRVSYYGQFLNNRVSVSAYANVTKSETEVTTGGRGEVRLDVFPLFGFSSLDDTPSEGALDQNIALIDGNFAASAGINIGLIPTGSDSRERNIGLDFFADAEINTLYVWVDRELPADLAASYTWDVYTSSDNLRWTLIATLSRVPFGPFQNRFELRFSTVRSRYIKVVTRPLQPGVPDSTRFPDIFITELQAFSAIPAADVTGKINRTSEIYDFNTRVLLLERPGLYYDLQYSSSKSQNSRRSVLSNSLFATHRFSPVFSGSARVAREDSVETIGDGVSYVYMASLNAVPLPALSHTLTFNGRFEDIAGVSLDRNSVYLFNVAQLYRGISANLDGGVELSTLGTGEKQTATLFNVGATIIPHRTLTVNLRYSDNTTKQTGGTQDRTTFDRRMDASVAYNPFPTVYLFAAVGLLKTEARKLTTQNYAVNWSPFQGGALQFNFNYSDDIEVETDIATRTIRPSIRWNITPRTHFDLAYEILRSTTERGSVDQEIFSASLRMPL